VGNKEKIPKKEPNRPLIMQEKNANTRENIKPHYLEKKDV
jgi:hypothetical protein